MTDNLPTNWQEQMANEAKALSRVFRPSTAQISTRSGMLTYMNQPIPGNKLDCIVLASIFENNYFEGRFDPKNPRNPICYSFGKPESDGSKPEMVPYHEIAEPFAKTCDQCEYSKWGSDPDSVSGKGKRCKEIYKLGLVPYSVDDSLQEMAILRIPVTSRKNWEVYVNGVAASAMRPPWGVVTTIGCRPHPKNQFEIFFEAKEVIPEDRLGDIFRKINGAYDALMQKYDENSDPLEKKPPREGKKKY